MIKKGLIYTGYQLSLVIFLKLFLEVSFYDRYSFR